MEHVAAGEPAHAVPVIECAEADDAPVPIRGSVAGETAGGGGVDIEQVGERDEAGAEGGEGGAVGAEVEPRGWGDAERVEDGGEGGAETAEAGSEQGEEE